MRNLKVVLLAFAVILAACSPRLIPLPTQAPVLLGTPTAGISAPGTRAPGLPSSLDTPTAGAVSQPTTTHVPVDIPAAQRAAIDTLSQSLGMPASAISVVSSEAVTWPNGCLGVTRIGVMCTQFQVPGFKIILSAGGKQYEVHTNQDGTSVAPSEAMQAPGPAEAVAAKQLATNLGIPVREVKVDSSTPIEFPNSCLGVSQQGVMCAQVVTPGYLIVLEANGRQYEYHTNQDASFILPASLGMNWTQQGGIAGLCQNLEVYLSGEFYGLNCKGGGDGRMGLLKASERKQLESWVDALSPTAIDLSDPKGAADAMTRLANLNGTGSQQATDAQEHDIFAFGQGLYHNLYP